MVAVLQQQGLHLLQDLLKADHILHVEVLQFDPVVRKVILQQPRQALAPFRLRAAVVGAGGKQQVLIIARLLVEVLVKGVVRAGRSGQFRFLFLIVVRPGNPGDEDGAGGGEGGICLGHLEASEKSGNKILVGDGSPAVRSRI